MALPWWAALACTRSVTAASFFTEQRRTAPQFFCVCCVVLYCVCNHVDVTQVRGCVDPFSGSEPHDPGSTHLRFPEPHSKCAWLQPLAHGRPVLHCHSSQPQVNIFCAFVCAGVCVSLSFSLSVSVPLSLPLFWALDHSSLLHALTDLPPFTSCVWTSHQWIVWKCSGSHQHRLVHPQRLQDIYNRALFVCV